MKKITQLFATVVVIAPALGLASPDAAALGLQSCQDVLDKNLDLSQEYEFFIGGDRNKPFYATCDQKGNTWLDLSPGFSYANWLVGNRNYTTYYDKIKLELPTLYVEKTDTTFTRTSSTTDIDVFFGTLTVKDNIHPVSSEIDLGNLPFQYHVEDIQCRENGQVSRDESTGIITITAPAGEKNEYCSTWDNPLRYKQQQSQQQAVLFHEPLFLTSYHTLKLGRVDGSIAQSYDKKIDEQWTMIKADQWEQTGELHYGDKVLVRDSAGNYLSASDGISSSRQQGAGQTWTVVNANHLSSRDIVYHGQAIALASVNNKYLIARGSNTDVYEDGVAGEPSIGEWGKWRLSPVFKNKTKVHIVADATFGTEKNLQAHFENQRHNWQNVEAKLLKTGSDRLFSRYELIPTPTLGNYSYQIACNYLSLEIVTPGRINKDLRCSQDIGISEDNTWLLKPLVDLENPLRRYHLKNKKSGQYIKLFRPSRELTENTTTLLTLVEQPDADSVWLINRHKDLDIEARHVQWHLLQAAIKSKEVSAIEEYLLAFPSGFEEVRARQYLAVYTGLTAVEAFASQYPNSAKEAYYRFALHENTPKSYNLYLSKYSNQADWQSDWIQDKKDEWLEKTWNELTQSNDTNAPALVSAVIGAHWYDIPSYFQDDLVWRWATLIHEPWLYAWYYEHMTRGDHVEEAKFNEAKAKAADFKKNNPNSPPHDRIRFYEEYLDKHPSGKYIAEAYGIIANKLFFDAEQVNTPKAYKTYLQELAIYENNYRTLFANGALNHYRERAQRRIDAYLWQVYINVDSVRVVAGGNLDLINMNFVLHIDDFPALDEEGGIIDFKVDKTLYTQPVEISLDQGHSFSPPNAWDVVTVKDNINVYTTKLCETDDLWPTCADNITSQSDLFLRMDDLPDSGAESLVTKRVTITDGQQVDITYKVRKMTQEKYLTWLGEKTHKCGEDAVRLADIPTYQGPGFIIRNETEYPVDIALSQTSPLYFETIQPGQLFIRDTGAVWFSIEASVNITGVPKHSTASSAFDIGLTVAAVSTSIATGGLTSGFAGGLLGAAKVAGGITNVARKQILKNVLVGSASSLTQKAARNVALETFFADDYVEETLHGQYAGAPWPFRENLKAYRITGGPKQPCATQNGQIWIPPSSKLNIIAPN